MVFPRSPDACGSFCHCVVVSSAAAVQELILRSCYFLRASSSIRTADRRCCCVVVVVGDVTEDVEGPELGQWKFSSGLETVTTAAAAS